MEEQQEKTTKGQHGGFRPGAGRKAKAGKGKSFRVLGLRLDEETYNILVEQQDKTGYIMKAVKFYHRNGEV